MKQELKKESKVDLFLSKVEEKVVICYESGSKDANVKIPTYFTKEEIKDVMWGANVLLSQNFLSYTKERPKVSIELGDNEFYLFIRWK